MTVILSQPAKGAITTDIIISDLPDDVIAALGAIADRCAVTRAELIADVLFREATRPRRIVTERERAEGHARLAGLRDDALMQKAWS